MTEHSPPERCDVLIVGGGPAGSSAAAFLAKSGVDVVVLERAEFPRNQVGESLIPHFWKFADSLGVSGDIEKESFISKAGGITVWNGQARQIRFSDFGYNRPGLHVERDRFDQILLRHAENSGARVFAPVVARKVDFSDSQWPVVSYIDKRGDGNATGSLRCQYVIDASGHSTFLASQFKTRHTVSAKMNFLSLWGYFTDARFVGVDRHSHEPEALTRVQPVTFVMSHKDGWLWHIILREKTSVGLIINNDQLKEMDREGREQFFHRTCAKLPFLNRLLEPARFIEGSLQFRPDYSYYSTRICGENFYCIGDAGAFVDPIFSHGVQNAFYNAATVSLSITASLKNSRNRLRYSRLCESRMQQFYGFSRSLALGDFGCNGVQREQVINLMKTLPALELELMMVAAEMTSRSDNFWQLLEDAGLSGSFRENMHCKGFSELGALRI